MRSMAMPKPTETASVFERYRRDVYGWAYRLLGRHHDALDAAQDVFLRWIDQSRRAAPENPRGWLRQVTVNRAIDLLRRRREAGSGCPIPPRHGEAGRSRVGWGTECDVIETAAPRTGLGDPVEREELRTDIVEALQNLTDAQRSVLIARVYDGLTFAQIAEEQGLAVPTVKTHYLRALSSVRGRLARRWGPERT